MQPDVAAKDGGFAVVAAVDWAATLAPVRRWLDAPDAPPSRPWRTVVLVPYAQLMAHAREQALAAWAREGLAPRFETSNNWARSLGPFVPGPLDYAFDPALDWPTAATLLQAAGLTQDAKILAPTLCAAVAELVSVASAQLPSQRMAWAQSRMDGLLQPGLDWSTALDTEARISQVALAWLGNSAFATDRLLAVVQSDRLGSAPEKVFVLTGLQPQPFDATLQAVLGHRCEHLPWELTRGSVGVRAQSALPPGSPNTLQTHPSLDAEDEAQRCAAQVSLALAQHRRVALVAQDRWLVRRVLATLAFSPGVPAHTVRDETGWKLSTTVAGARIMAVLRASHGLASTDAALAAFKACGMETRAMEAALRRLGQPIWRRAQDAWVNSSGVSVPPDLALAISAIETLTRLLGSPRQLSRLVGGLAAAIDALIPTHAGSNSAAVDAAHLACCQALRFGAPDWADMTLTATGFSAWVTHVLESTHFQPPDAAIDPNNPVLCVVPLPQLLARGFDALIFAGAGEESLASPLPEAGWWTSAQRQLLGLPSMAQLHSVTTHAFAIAVQQPNAHLMWRTQAQGQDRLPSPWVLRLLLDGHPLQAWQVQTAVDPRETHHWPKLPTLEPIARSHQAAPIHLSASAYRDFRACPYRYHAVHVLGLREAPELGEGPDKRDMGVWLHLTFKHFHEGGSLADRVGHIDACALRAKQELGLDDALFLPFAAAWPRVRGRYLSWLTAHEQSQHQFDKAEWPLQRVHAGLTLRGTLDRVDASAQAGLLVIDYKSDSGQAAARLSVDEDVQLPFYAALLQSQVSSTPVSAGYLQVSDAKAMPTKLITHPHLAQSTQSLLDAIDSDFSRLREGAPMLALGKGQACAHCQARGMCRRDFWTTADAHETHETHETPEGDFYPGERL